MCKCCISFHKQFSSALFLTPFQYVNDHKYLHHANTRLHKHLWVLVVVHHLLLHSRGYILHIDPGTSEVASPETQRAVFRRGGQHSACSIPSDSPDIGLGGALNGLGGHILQRAIFLPVQLVDLKICSGWSDEIKGDSAAKSKQNTLKVGSLLAVAIRW